MNITKKEMKSILYTTLVYGLNLSIDFESKGIVINVIKHDQNGVEYHFRYAEFDNNEGGFTDHRQVFKNCVSIDDMVVEIEMNFKSLDNIEVPKIASYSEHSKPILSVIMASLFNKTSVSLTYNKELNNEFQLTF